MVEEQIWSRVEGLSFDGVTFGGLLTELVEGTIAAEMKDELLADCCRDWEASTAGYAAVPWLLRDGYPPRLAWELAWTAGQILTEEIMSGSPPVPEFLKDRVNGKAKVLAVERLRHGVAFADLSLVELIQTISLIADLSGRADLGGKLTRIALAERGMPDVWIDENYPPD